MLEVRVARKIAEAEGVCSFELAAANGAELPPFTAGSHIDVHVAPGIVRQYSLCNSPHERGRYLIAVLDEPASRGGSRGMHADVQEGSRLAIGAPRNLFDLDLGGDRYLLFAGGIGITPMLAMAHSLLAAGKRFELHYCGRSIERLAFLGLLNEAPFAKHLRVHVDNGPVEQRLDAAQVLALPAQGDQLYVCGPSGFMSHIQATAKASGWSDRQFHREDFTAPPQVLEGDRAFEIELSSSGRVLQVPAQKTALEVLLAHGVAIESACEQGICGTCITRVLAGEPDHRDQYLDAAEHARNDSFTPCCSRSRSPRLVLDL
ncbi:vanillate O-demethylase ferredoxin subunit [Pseudomonas delhiensis]|uniref:Vanillate O-demethylase ferredoxin subunit n=1 Tax=Pseudomonas delhiensis TaxID=366289 RepID=A0A239NF02_9PSED|nr:PDR/VanB family oxidoreductase [Pseudomonas delhiensis]SDK36488.1 vanillate O-demethylase ferredoxin subunit [Pseudomonas delhiensis]SNT53547.1 vanillate O-demethylase ferredoxin subunit [Pseudomonas delhiensis]